MSYLKFDKTMLINLEESLLREVLRTNRKGAYHCTTIVDCNTRKYHGVLVMPVPGLDDENHVLLSSLDETVIQHGAAFNLGLHKYEGNNFSPNGHKYVREYTMDVVPHTVYRVGGVVLAKEKIFSKTDNQILIKYTLLEAHSATTLRFRPFLAFRSVRDLSHANDFANLSYHEVPNGIRMCLYEGYPDLYMQFNKKPRFVYEPYWYNNIEYPKEQERGYEYKEDLLVPGYFELPIRRHESIIFCAGDIQRRGLTLLPGQFEDEVKERTPRSSFFNCLKNSVHQLAYRPNNGANVYLLAGYPWFKVRARDMFIAMPGATLCIGEEDMYRQLMNTAVPALRTFMHDGMPDKVIRELNEPDVLLWAVWCVQQFGLKKGPDETRTLYGELVREIIDYIIAQKHPNMKLAYDGLLYCDGRHKPVTWMNSMANGRPVIPRSGFIVEHNALWYNALCFAQELNGGTRETERLIRELNASFPATFVNEHNYLFDYVDGSTRDWSVRPNMVIALACPYSPLSRAQKRAALDIVTKELLTPKGLRSLSPKSNGYHPDCSGSQYERDLAYHQGAAWPWLLGMYLTAYLDLLKQSGVSFAERMLISLEEEISHHCIGTLSEVFDGNPPFAARGAFSFLTSIAAVLQVIDKIRIYDVE
ncbi:MAG: amylo-alpha-1,6-glucosidase [Tannerella sp.]|jgi:predicted glycogen debranching enzyme|nr:amylo-alpha-1,6-glucosidase [Tannerella sp.]